MQAAMDWQCLTHAEQRQLLSAWQALGQLPGSLPLP